MRETRLEGGTQAWEHVSRKVDFKTKDRRRAVLPASRVVRCDFVPVLNCLFLCEIRKTGNKTREEATKRAKGRLDGEVIG